VPSSSCLLHQVTILTRLSTNPAAAPYAVFSGLLLLLLRPIQSATGLLRSSADHRPAAPFLIPAGQKTVPPSPRLFRPSACNNWRTAGRIFLKFVVEEIFIGRRSHSSEKSPVSFVMSVRLPVFPHLSRISIAHFCENPPRHSEFG
jgi:hypothetical protein